MSNRINKKLNHYVPRGYLRGWEITFPKFQHLVVFDIESQKFISPNKERSFAAEDDLYIFNEDGTRNTAVEDFFQAGEKALGLFRDIVLKGKIPNLSKKLHSDLIEGIGALQYRNPRTLKIYETILKSSSASEKVKIEKDHILELMVNNIQYTKTHYKNASILIMIFKSDDIITNESPLFDVANSKFKQNVMFFPVTSNSIALIGESTALEPFGFKAERNPALMIVDARKDDIDDKKTLDTFNYFTIAQTRKWIVLSKNHSDLELITSQLSREQVAARANLDVVRIYYNGEELVLSLDEIDTEDTW